ncbi:MAG: glycosyltransferase, partial [Candidatus Syntrophosphaera sp.]
ILVSEALIEPLKLAKGRIPDPVILPNGLDLSRFEPAPKSINPSKLLYIGNLFPAKGVQYLIQALAILKSQGHDFYLDVVGSGAYGRELEQLAITLNVHDKVSFKGVVLPDQIPELLTRHDALVLPTLKESFGIVLIEALASGLPVISTYSGGPEHIVGPEVGILVKPGSGQALSEGIIRLFNKWDNFEPERIREYCRNHFDIRRISPKLAQIYREAVDTK